MNNPIPLAVVARDTPLRTKPSNYPKVFADRITDRDKHPLGALFGLKNFGVNLTRLGPGCPSALLHSHARQDEFIYIVEGTAVLVTDEGELELSAGMCAGFPAGGRAHMLENRGTEDVYYLEIGDRSFPDEITYPQDDIQARSDENGAFSFTRKDGTPL